MKVEDIVQILNNRLREFKLSRNYATMSGDLERVNVADKEILDLEDTLFKLNLLVDTTKSAAVEETILAEVITDGSVAVLGEYDITSYATDPLHEKKVMSILSKMGVMDTAEKIDAYIKGKYLSSPVTGEMIMSAASAYSVDARLMMAIMEQDSSFGTAGLAVSTLNPGNVGNDDAGNIRTYESWQDGVTAVAAWLNRHHGTTIIPETPPILAPTTTTTTTITTAVTSTPAFTPPTSTPVFVTTTPEAVPPVTTSTTTITTAASSTPAFTPPTSTPVFVTTTPEAVPPVTTSTTTITTAASSTPAFTPPTSTPVFVTTTPEAVPPVTTSTTTITTATTTTEEATPVITSTTAVTTAPATTNAETVPETTPETAPETAPTTATTPAEQQETSTT